MIIDEKGRLFSKVNVIDLFIVVAVVAAAAFIFTRFSSPVSTVGAAEEDVVITFFAEEASDFVGDAIVIGDRVEDESKNVDLGEVFEVNLGQGYLYASTDDGKLKRADKEGYKSVEIKSLLKAPYTDNTFLVVSGNKYGVGHSFTIRVGKAKIFLKISGIEKQSS